MTQYRVSIWASVTVEAVSEDDALEVAHDMLVNGDIRNKDFFLEVQEELETEDND